MANRNRTQFPATTFTDVLVVLVAILLLGLVAGLLDGCASEVPMPQETVTRECIGYMVTSQCPGAPMSMGMPVIGCHDDAGVFHGGCTYNAGPAGHETTSLCALVCPGF